jgi:holo-[acyl-carrier protein] synthase
MIFGIGSDVVQISRIDSLLNRWGTRFLQRVFTEKEVQYCLARKAPSPHLAVRFAAKEAFLKALGVGYSGGVRWKDIEVTHKPSGRPDVELHNRTKTLCEHCGIDRVHLSMSHDGAYGFVQVILESQERRLSDPRPGVASSDE